MDCDHIIGVRIADDGEFIHQSQEAEITAFVMAKALKWAANPRANPERAKTICDYTSRQHLEDAYEMFSFCPDCDAKLR